MLATLCEAAERLRLDLVIERRVDDRKADGTIGLGRYDIRLEVPGAPVPEKASGCFDDLAWALARTTVMDLLRDQLLHPRAAPAHFLRVGLPAHRGPAVTEPVAEIANRIERLCGEHPGATAIWRDRRWHFTPLIALAEVEKIEPQLTGQFQASTVTVLARASEPAAPGYLGAPIPTRACPHCAGGLITEPCPCAHDATLGADAGCADCSGSGLKPILSCRACSDTGQLHYGAVMTIIDDDRTLHVNWPVPDDAEAPAVDMPRWMGNRAVPPEYTAAHWARQIGADPAALTGCGVEYLDELIAGTVYTGRDGLAAVADYLRERTAGRTGARIFLQVREPDPTVAEVMRAAFGLGLAVDISLATYRHTILGTGERTPDRWGIRLALPDTAVTWCGGASRRLDVAAAALLEDLPNTVGMLVHGAVPQWPLPVPQAPTPVEADTFGYLALLDKAADYLAPLGEDLLVRLTPARAAIHGTRSASEVRHVATAADLRAAIALLHPNNGG